MRQRRLLRATAFTSPILLVALATTVMPTAQALSRHAAAGSPVTTLSPAQARALSTNVTDKVIVVFKNQVAALPDTTANSVVRAAAVRNLQQGVLSELAATHASNVHSISLVNAVSATVSPGMAKLLAANPAVARVVRDLPIPVARDPRFRPSAAVGLKPLAGACAPKGQVQLNPEAVTAIHAASGTSAQGLGYTGAGVKVAWIADGINPNNPDFIRANGTHVFVDYKDFSGSGTNAPTDGGEAFLDASSIAAQGRHVYNVSGYAVNLTVPCDIRILGVAPGASLVGLNVFGAGLAAFNSIFLRAIDYAVTHDHVNVINESFGSNAFPDLANLDLVREADDAAVKAGVSVDVASGDAGPTNTIGSPATDPNVVSVGATTTFRAYAQTGINGITLPGVKGWLDNNISAISSGGFDQAGHTVDVVAPGDANWALCTPTMQFAACFNFAGKPAAFELTGGTSESAPLTAGVSALVIQAYRQAHHGATPPPAVIKQIIMSTAQNINAPAEQQGAGMVDAYQAVLAARSFHGSAIKPAGHAILASPTQLNAVAQVGTSEQFAEKLTNDGASPVTVGVSSRTLAAYHPVLTKTLTLTPSQGFQTIVSFAVPKGQARLNVSASLQGLILVALISPNGKFAANNLPQGQGNYGNAQVANPAPGTWRALVAAAVNSGPFGGPPGPVTAAFQASTATWKPFGLVSAPSLTLAPGASGTVTLTVSTPSQAGDQSGSIIVRSSAASPAFASVSSIPITLRSLVPPPNPTTTVVGTLTGGNGRASNTGQTAYYQVQVPSGLSALNVNVDTGDPTNFLFAELVAPDGEVASAANNGLAVASPTGFLELQPEIGTQLHVMNPGAGLWTLIVDFYSAVSGTAVAQPFTITFDDTPVSASANGLPDSAATQLPAGQPVTASVTVTNSGTTPEAYFVDARLNGQVHMSLANQSLPVVLIPNPGFFLPEYIVPSHTTALAVTVSASLPLYFDFFYPFGDPDIGSTSGKTAHGSFTAPDVPAGLWSVAPNLVGPFGPKPAKFIEGTASMTATTAAFDPTVSTPTGDMWLASTNVSAGFTPYVVNPGQSVTIPVTITPAGISGTTVSGTIYLSDSSLQPGAVTTVPIGGAFPTGSDVAAFPYTYTIK